MSNIATRQFYIIVTFAFIALLLNAAIPIYSLHKLKVSNAEALMARVNIETLDHLLLSAVDAETGMRGYVITGNSQFLEPYFNSQARIDTLLIQLEKSLDVGGTPNPMVKDLKHKILNFLERLKDTVNTRQLKGEVAATNMVMSGEGKRRMDAVRAVAQKLRLLDNEKLQQLEMKYAQVVSYTNNALVLLTLIDLILFSAALFFLLKSLKTSKATQDNLNTLHMESVKHSAMLTQQNHVKVLQARLNEALQSVLSPEEAYQAISNYCQRLFPQYAGAFYIKSNSKDYFECTLQWGKISQSDGFEPGDCWAARSNNVYRYDYVSQELPCPHYASHDHSHVALCLPVSTTDEMLGIMTLIDPDKVLNPDAVINEQDEIIAREVVGYIGLAITNLRLRDNLKKSAIVDVLTGLYNRRYLNETLMRELARAHRNKHCLGIIMLDVDHFKMFNDTYGHEAGDLVLKEVGGLLKSFCRTSDIPCRFGGEEFVLVLPDADAEIVSQRAESLRIAVKAINLTYGGNILPSISISAGVSVFPTDATEAESLLKTADDALYQAKRNGRDQVHVYLKS